MIKSIIVLTLLQLFYLGIFGLIIRETSKQKRSVLLYNILLWIDLIGLLFICYGTVQMIRTPLSADVFVLSMYVIIFPGVLTFLAMIIFIISQMIKKDV